MKNARLIASILLVALLCASLAYWALKLIRPAERPLAAPQQARQEVNMDAAAGLFGGRPGAAVATNYQLRGVIDAANNADSVAIIAASGKPAQAVAVGGELSPGVVVKEVHPRYVLLSENGVSKRIELPEKMPPSTAPSQAGSSPAIPAQPAQGARPPATTPNPPPAPAQKMAQPSTPAQSVPAQPAQPGVTGQAGQNVQPASQMPATRRARRSSSMVQQASAQNGV